MARCYGVTTELRGCRLDWPHIEDHSSTPPKRNRRPRERDVLDAVRDLLAEDLSVDGAARLDVVRRWFDLPASASA